ncbi:MAG: hypothetical protein KGM44_03250 [bacterium]|nr:hypothetical protein [bacterium]
MTRSTTTPTTATLAVLATLTLAACSGGGGASMGGMPATADSPAPTSMPGVMTAPIMVDSDRGGDDLGPDDANSVLRQLDEQRTIGSTVDPLNGDQNPYGLAVAQVGAGKIAAGDLVICNFNNAANVQGTGTTIVALHPRPGSNPARVAQDAALLGCTEVALAPNGNIWASAFAANDNPVFTPGGSLVTTLPGGPWHGPFGQTFAAHAGPFGTAAFYESNAADGSIVRININPGPKFSFDVIATGFAVNHGVPGSILGPSGLQYDAQHDRLYIVDGTDNTLVAFRHVSTIPAHGIVVNGASFGGPFARRAHVVFSGPPLNGPISSALLPGGHLVLGNTLDPNGKNLTVEITPHGRLLAVKNVDTGAAGALFGMAASGQRGEETRLYFNDDNDNTIRVLER